MWPNGIRGQCVTAELEIFGVTIVVAESPPKNTGDRERRAVPTHPPRWKMMWTANVAQQQNIGATQRSVGGVKKWLNPTRWWFPANGGCRKWRADNFCGGPGSTFKSFWTLFHCLGFVCLFLENTCLIIMQSSQWPSVFSEWQSEIWRGQCQKKIYPGLGRLA